MLRFSYNINEPPNSGSCLKSEKHTIMIGFGIAIPEVALEATQDLNRIREATASRFHFLTISAIFFF